MLYPKPNPNSNPNPDPTQKPNPNPNHNLIINIHIHPTPIPNINHNPHPNPNPNPHPHPTPHPNPTPIPHPTPNPNRNPSPNPNSDKDTARRRTVTPKGEEPLPHQRRLREPVSRMPPPCNGPVTILTTVVPLLWDGADSSVSQVCVAPLGGSGFDSRKESTNRTAASTKCVANAESYVLQTELTYAGSGLKTRPVARAPTSVTRTKLRESVTVRSSYRYCAHASRVQAGIDFESMLVPTFAILGPILAIC